VATWVWVFVALGLLGFLGSLLLGRWAKKRQPPDGESKREGFGKFLLDAFLSLFFR
jgi:hypothetical protein